MRLQKMYEHNHPYSAIVLWETNHTLLMAYRRDGFSLFFRRMIPSIEIEWMSRGDDRIVRIEVPRLESTGETIIQFPLWKH